MAEQYYTVNSAKRLDGRDNYGNVTDSVFFKEYEGSVLWKHQEGTQATPGTQVYGEIQSLTSQGGKQYNKFTKKQVPEGSFVGPANSPTQPTRNNAEASNGAKAGMAINNAAAYVIAQAGYDNTRLEPEEFAAEINRYAKEIYKLDPAAKNESDELLDFLNS